jgi:hypothetical protein
MSSTRKTMAADEVWAVVVDGVALLALHPHLVVFLSGKLRCDRCRASHRWKVKRDLSSHADFCHGRRTNPRNRVDA